MVNEQTTIITVTLNPAIDCVFEVPGLQIGGHLKGECLCQIPAGKGINVARGLSRFDIPCLVTGFVGDTDHPLYRDSLESMNGKDCLIPVQGNTRRNITLLDPANQTETHIRDRGFCVSEQNVNDLGRLIRDHSSPGTIIVFSGSLPPGISDAELDRLVLECLDYRMRVAVDTSGPSLSTVSKRPVWLIKPNKEELEELSSRTITNEEEFLSAGRTVCQSTGGLVLASWGKRGAYLFTGEKTWKGNVNVEEESPTSTVGCGDAMMAGFIAGILKNMTFPEALKQSLATASASARSQIPSDFSLPMFDSMIRRTSIEPID